MGFCGTGYLQPACDHAVERIVATATDTNDLQAEAQVEVVLM